jgi:hypothetical protein
MRNSILLSTGLILISTMVFMSCRTAKNVTKPNPETTVQKDSISTIHVGSDLSLPDTNDAFSILNVALKGDILEIEVSYGGGCREHDFDLQFNGLYKKSMPAQAAIWLVHENHGDACRAMIQKKLYYNISSIRNPSGKPGELHISLAGWNERIVYRWE